MSSSNNFMDSQISRRSLLASSGPSLAAAQQSSKPNVLFFLPDQVRLCETGYNGGKNTRLQHRSLRQPGHEFQKRVVDLPAVHAVPGHAADRAVADAVRRRHETGSICPPRDNRSARFSRAAATIQATSASGIWLPAPEPALSSAASLSPLRPNRNSCRPAPGAWDINIGGVQFSRQLQQSVLLSRHLDSGW